MYRILNTIEGWEVWMGPTYLKSFRSKTDAEDYLDFLVDWNEYTGAN